MTTQEFQYKLIHFQKSLIVFAYRLTSDDQNAWVLLQKKNLKALNYCDRFVYETNFIAWTFTIMKNTFINDYRCRIHLDIINGMDGISMLNQIKTGLKQNILLL